MTGLPRALAPAAWLVLSALLAAPPASAALTQRGRMLMGTMCTAVVEAPDGAAARTAADGALETIAALEDVMSSWRPASELSRMNALAGESPFTCSDTLFAVLDSSLVLARETDGAFEPTIDPLVTAWGQRGAGRVPAVDEKARARALVDWHGLALDSATHAATFAKPGMAVDLGGIGKGFALDRCAARFAGIDSVRALVNIGGEVLAIGGWDVSVAHPSNRMMPVVRLHVVDASVSTSAQSERGVEIAGRRYGHILDPATGDPIPRAGSVTVVARSATRADALSTALFVMGRERARAFARAHPEIGVLWLEPAEQGLRAWRWNLNDASAEAEAKVEWMTD